MKTLRLQRLLILTLALIFLPRFSFAQDPKPLFNAIDKPAPGVIQNNSPTIVQQRYVEINFDLLLKPSDVKRGESIDLQADALSEELPAQDNRFILDLFEGVSYMLVLERVENMSPDGSTLTWFGHIEGVTNSEVILVTSDKIMSGNIALPGGIFYQIRYPGGNIHVIREIDQRGYGQGVEPKEQIPPDENIQQDTTNAVDTQSCADGPLDASESYDESGSTIDVMVVYTPAARAANGGTSGMNTLIDLAVSETNTGYANSGIIQRINLVHREEVVYTESTPPNPDSTVVFDDALDALEGKTDGEMDNVHTLRDDYGADILSLFVHDPTTNWCGKSIIMNTESHSFENQAFNVVDWDCATGYYSFAHEMGHNQGARHDRAHDNSDGVFSYSHGYQDPEGDFRTIMAYNCPGGCIRVNYWSNPDNDYIVGGTNYGPMGVVYTATDSADNRRSHNNTRDTVANWRPRYVYVDGSYSGTETGLSANPFNTLSEGVAKIGKYATNARLYIKAGTYTGSGNVPITITRPMTIYNWGSGSIVIE